MSTIKGISIDFRSIILTISIPKENVWIFVESFGREFAQQDPMEGVVFFRVIHKYHHIIGSPDFTIEVEIWEDEEEKFNSFLKRFCEARSIPFSKFE
jgi:hypothetical protein